MFHPYTLLTKIQSFSTIIAFQQKSYIFIHYTFLTKTQIFIQSPPLNCAPFVYPLPRGTTMFVGSCSPIRGPVLSLSAIDLATLTALECPTFEFYSLVCSIFFWLQDGLRKIPISLEGFNLECTCGFVYRLVKLHVI